MLDGVVDLIEQIGLDRHDDHLDLRGVAAIHELVIPDDLVDRVGNVLLRLEGDDLIHLLLADRRQLHEAREDRLRGNRVIDLSPFEPQPPTISGNISLACASRVASAADRRAVRAFRRR